MSVGFHVRCYSNDGLLGFTACTVICCPDVHPSEPNSIILNTGSPSSSRNQNMVQAPGRCQQIHFYHYLVRNLILGCFVQFVKFKLNFSTLTCTGHPTYIAGHWVCLLSAGGMLYCPRRRCLSTGYLPYDILLVHT